MVVEMLIRLEAPSIFNILFPGNAFHHVYDITIPTRESELVLNV
jgi:hypothetical protein